MKKTYYFCAFSTFNISLIILFKKKRNESKKYVEKQGKKTVKQTSEKGANCNVSTTKSKAGRPGSGTVKGVLPKHRKDVIRDMLSWQEMNYLQEDNPTSIKALAQWAHKSMVFRSETGKELSLTTIEQEFGEVWREKHLEITIRKRIKREEHKRKILHNN